MNKQKYLKVMFGNKGANYEYKIDEINVATVWNPNAEKGRDFGGFNYASEESILRWLHRGIQFTMLKYPMMLKILN